MTTINVITAHDVTTGEVHFLCQEHYTTCFKACQQHVFQGPPQQVKWKGHKEDCNFLLYVVPVSKMYQHFGEDLVMREVSDLEDLPEDVGFEPVPCNKVMGQILSSLQYWSTRARPFGRTGGGESSWVFTPVWRCSTYQYWESKALEFCLNSCGQHFTDWKIETLKLDITPTRI